MTKFLLQTCFKPNLKLSFKVIRLYDFYRERLFSFKRSCWKVFLSDKYNETEAKLRIYNTLFGLSRRILKTRVISTHLSTLLCSFLPRFQKYGLFHDFHTPCSLFQPTTLWICGSIYGFGPL